MAIGDVSGKGIAAALMMASLQASLRSEATRAPENLAAAVANVNRRGYTKPRLPIAMQPSSMANMTRFRANSIM